MAPLRERPGHSCLLYSADHSLHPQQQGTTLHSETNLKIPAPQCVRCIRIACGGKGGGGHANSCTLQQPIVTS